MKRSITFCNTLLILKTVSEYLKTHNDSWEYEQRFVPKNSKSYGNIYFNIPNTSSEIYNINKFLKILDIDIYVEEIKFQRIIKVNRNLSLHDINNYLGKMY